MLEANVKRAREVARRLTNEAAAAMGPWTMGRWLVLHRAACLAARLHRLALDRWTLGTARYAAGAS